MAQQNINIGTANNQNGDFVRDAWAKAEDNFTELYNLQFLSDRIISGTVTWTGGLTFNVNINSYIKNGNVLPVINPFVQDTVTLSAADPTNDRIDIIAVTESETIVVIEGTPSATPVEPLLTDYDTQLQVTSITIPAASAVPQGVSRELVFGQNVGEPAEWTASENTGGLRINLGSTNDPDVDTISLETINWTNTDSFTFTNNTLVNTADIDNLSFRLKNKTSDSTTIVIRMYSGLTKVTTDIYLSNGIFGYDETDTSDYQSISISKADFAFTSSSFDSIEFVLKAGSDILIDEVYLNSGTEVLTPIEITFLDLLDTESSYSGKAGQVPVVNNTEDGLEFITITGAGGGEDLAQTTAIGNVTPDDIFIDIVDSGSSIHGYTARLDSDNDMYAELGVLQKGAGAGEGIVTLGNGTGFGRISCENVVSNYILNIPDGSLGNEIIAVSASDGSTTVQSDSAGNLDLSGLSLGGGSTPDLEQVTDVGNSTNNGILFQSDAATLGDRRFYLHGEEGSPDISVGVLGFGNPAPLNGFLNFPYLGDSTTRTLVSQATDGSTTIVADATGLLDLSALSLGGGGGAFIPLSGTTAGNDVSGAVEFGDGGVTNIESFILNSVTDQQNAADAYNSFGLSVDDGTTQATIKIINEIGETPELEIGAYTSATNFNLFNGNSWSSRNGVNVTGLSLQDNIGVLVTNSYASSRGLYGAIYYGANYTDNSFVQKQYVDDIFNTDSGSSPFYLTRTGSNTQALSIYVDDADVYFESIQDEDSSTNGGFIFKLDDGGTAVPKFRIWQGTDNYFSVQPSSDGLTSIFEDAEGTLPLRAESVADTGTVIDLSNPLGISANMSSANTSTSYTLTGVTEGGWSQIKINTATEPTITDGSFTIVEEIGTPWQASTVMYLNVKYNGTEVVYFFSPYTTSTTTTTSAPIEFAFTAEEGDIVADAVNPVYTDYIARDMPNVELPFIRLAFTAPTGSAAEFDIHINGTSVFSTEPTIDATENTTDTAATPAVLSNSNWSKGDKIEFFVTQVGSTIAGAGGKCTITTL